MMGDIYLYYGTGAGKTTNALGLALRCIGHNKRVVFVQFLKWWTKTGEYKVSKLLKNFSIYQFGRKGWQGKDNLTTEDKELTMKGFTFADQVLYDRKPHLLVLDELALACAWDLIDAKTVASWLSKAKKTKTTIIVTGRYTSPELIEVADYVNVIVDEKHPEKMTSKRGIQW